MLNESSSDEDKASNDDEDEEAGEDSWEKDDPTDVDLKIDLDEDNCDN